MLTFLFSAFAPFWIFYTPFPALIRASVHFLPYISYNRVHLHRLAKKKTITSVNMHLFLFVSPSPVCPGDSVIIKPLMHLTTLYTSSLSRSLHLPNGHAGRGRPVITCVHCFTAWFVCCCASACLYGQCHLKWTLKFQFCVFTLWSQAHVMPVYSHIFVLLLQWVFITAVCIRPCVSVRGLSSCVSHETIMGCNWILWKLGPCSLLDKDNGWVAGMMGACL